MIENRATALPAADRRREWFAAALLVILPLGLYIPVYNGAFLWDDDSYLERNPLIRQPDGLETIWFEPRASPQYYPLVFTSFWIEYRLWGLDTTGYHVVNVVLHAISAVLLWRILVLLKLPGAWLAAAVFAVHPVNVETVAWVTERKNTLSCALALAAAFVYLRMRRATAEGEPFHRGAYLASLALFLGALLSKSVTASLPAVLLVIAWWQNGKVTRRDLLATLPMFALAIPLGLHTAWLERVHVGATGSAWESTPVEKVLVAGRVVWFYAAKLLVPIDQSFIYQRWRIDSDQAWQYLFPAAAVALVAGFWALRKRIGRGPLAASLIFGGVLLPVSGFFNVYPMQYSYVADHFAYHAGIALLALCACGFVRLCRRFELERLQTLTATSAVGVLGFLAFTRCMVFADPETLWRDALAKNPDSAMVHTNLGDLLQRQGRLNEAYGHFDRAVTLAPDRSLPALKLGILLYRVGRRDEAVAHLRKAVQLSPASARALTSLGAILTDHGDPREALAYLKKAVALDPKTGAMHYNLGRAYWRLGRRDEAQRSFDRAQQLNLKFVLPEP